MTVVQIAEKRLTWAEQLSRPLVRLLRHPVVENMVRLSAVEDSLRGLHPMLSLTDVRARVLQVVDETPQGATRTKTWLVQPNALWRGARAGQYVRVQAEINGRRLQRVYSLSSAPGERQIAFTVKRQGLFSDHLHEHLRPGQVITISQAMGDFVLPSALPAKVLLLSAGSGITPVMAMLRGLRAQGWAGDVQFVHVCRSPQDLIFATELAVLRHQGVQIHLHFSATEGRLTPEALPTLVPDLAERATWLCGPSGWMDDVQGLWRTRGYSAALHSERFAAAPLRPAQPLGQAVQVHALRRGQRFATAGADNLLLQAERAGLNPKHGCRIGICRSCQCTKRSGTVQNLQTGEISSAPDESIRLCISAARSDLSLDI